MGQNKRKSNKNNTTKTKSKTKTKKNTRSKKHRYYTGGKGKGNGKRNSVSTHTKRPLSVAKQQQIKSQYKTNPYTGTYGEADRRSLIKKGVRLTKKRSL